MEQEDIWMAEQNNLREVLMTEFPDHVDLPPFVYEDFFATPWAYTLEDEEKHKVVKYQKFQKKTFFWRICVLRLVTDWSVSLNN